MPGKDHETRNRPKQRRSGDRCGGRGCEIRLPHVMRWWQPFLESSTTLWRDVAGNFGRARTEVRAEVEYRSD